MALHSTPERHDADPPEKWQVVKVAERCWHLDSSLGYTLGTYKTRKAAQADKISGFYVNLYEKEGRWFRGEPVAGHRPYAEVAAERARNEAWQLGIRHGRAGIDPFGDLNDAGSALLMDELGETSPTTADNHAHRVALCDAYTRGLERDSKKG